MAEHVESCFNVQNLDLKEVTEWLEETFGPEGSDWVYVREIVGRHAVVGAIVQVYFRNLDDASAFKLRWM